MWENKTQINYFKVIWSRHYQQNRQQLLHVDSLRLNQLFHYMTVEARDAWAERGKKEMRKERERDW